jgi:hypothetical protein
MAGFKEKLTMRALPVKVIEPLSPVLGNADPPTLVVQIAPGVVDLKRLRCYVPDQPLAKLSFDPAVAGRVTVRAEAPLSGRRSKYTLTAPGLKGGWYWFSQLWVRTSAR